MGKQDDFFRTQIRIPSDVYESIRSSAEESGRSINAEMVHAMALGLGIKTSGTQEPDDCRYPVKLVVRIPEKLHENLQRTAIKSHRTLNAEMVMRLETTYYNVADLALDDSAMHRFSSLLKQMLKRMEDLPAFENELAEADEESRRNTPYVSAEEMFKDCECEEP